jgi:hypothetical protein
VSEFSQLPMTLTDHAPSSAPNPWQSNATHWPCGTDRERKGLSQLDESGGLPPRPTRGNTVL